VQTRKRETTHKELCEFKEYLYEKVLLVKYKILEHRLKRRLVFLVCINFLLLTIALSLFLYLLS